MLLPGVRRRVLRALLVLRPDPVGCEPAPEAEDHHEGDSFNESNKSYIVSAHPKLNCCLILCCVVSPDHQVRQVRGASRGGLLGGGDEHGEHELHAEAHIPKYRDLLRCPCLLFAARNLLLSAHSRHRKRMPLIFL